jgi:hypothetical protein
VHVIMVPRDKPVARRGEAGPGGVGRVGRGRTGRDTRGYNAALVPTAFLARSRIEFMPELSGRVATSVLYSERRRAAAHSTRSLDQTNGNSSPCHTKPNQPPARTDRSIGPVRFCAYIARHHMTNLSRVESEARSAKRDAKENVYHEYRTRFVDPLSSVRLFMRLVAFHEPCRDACGACGASCRVASRARR